MRAWILLALSLPAVGQVTGLLQPDMRATTAPALGKGKVGWWQLDLCNDDLTARRIQRQRITREAPGVTFLRNPIAQDLSLRAANRDVRSLIGSNGDKLLGLGAGIATAYGVAAKSSRAGWIGVGMDGFRFVFQLVAKDAPNPTSYYAGLLPDEVTIQPGECGSWYLVSGLMKKPEAVKITVQFGSSKVAP